MQTMTDLSVMIVVATAGITMPLAAIMGIVLAVRGLRRGGDYFILRISSVMFLIVCIDSSLLFILSDAWGNEDELAAALAGIGFGIIALGVYAASRQRQIASGTGAVTTDAHQDSDTGNIGVDDDHQ